MKTTGKVLLVAVLIYLVLAAAALAAMKQPPERFGRIMMHVPGPAFAIIPFKTLWLYARQGSLHVGDPAPGFNLSTQDRKGTVQLTTFRGSQPVVLVFGSYT